MREINVKYCKTFKLLLFRGCSRSFSLPLSPFLSLTAKGCCWTAAAVPNETKRKQKMRKKDEMKTQRKRETKETKAKRQKRQRQQQQPRAFRTAAAATTAQFPVE